MKQTLSKFCTLAYTSENKKKCTWKREWKSEIEKYEKSKSEKYERVKVKVMRAHSEFCMLACTSTFSHSSFVSFPSVSLLTALGFFLTFHICNFLFHTWGTASWSRSSSFPLSSCCSSRTSSFCQAESILAFDLSFLKTFQFSKHNHRKDNMYITSNLIQNFGAFFFDI